MSMSYVLQKAEFKTLHNKKNFSYHPIYHNFV
jgi:hypothetical protein